MDDEWAQRCAAHHFKGLRRLFDGKLYSDIDVQVDGQHFRCHRVILAAASDYFDAMFTSGMAESLTGVISLHDIGAECFERVLQYMYTSQMHLDEDNALETLCASDLLQILPLKECCEDFLTKNITLDNCIQLFHTAKLRHCTTLEMKSKDFVLSRFVELMRLQIISNLDEEEFFEIIADEHLNIPNENYAFQAADKWLHAEPERVLAHSVKIFELIRLPQIELDFLINEIQVKDYVQNNPELQEMVMDAVRYHVTPAVRQGFISGNIERRSTSKEEVTLICLESNSEIIVFDRQEHGWYTRKNMPHSHRYIQQTSEETYNCVIGNEYYLLNKERASSYLYLAYENEVIQMGTLPQNGGLFSVVGVENTAYCISYNDDKTNLVKIDSKTRTLMTVCGSNAGIRNAAVAVLRQNIYLFGGTVRSEIAVSTIYRFHMQPNTATVVGELPMAISHARATPYGSKIYIVTLDGNIIEFSETEGATLVTSIKNFSADGLDLVVWERSILIFTRSKGDSKTLPEDTAQIFTFDPAAGTAEKGNKLGLEINEKMTNFARILVPKRLK